MLTRKKCIENISQAFSLIEKVKGTVDSTEVVDGRIVTIRPKGDKTHYYYDIRRNGSKIYAKMPNNETVLCDETVLGSDNTTWESKMAYAIWTFVRCTQGFAKQNNIAIEFDWLGK